MKRSKIIWTEQAKLTLKEIYIYYKDISVQVARTMKTEILNSPKRILFSKQYQVDEINPKYRRIIVRHYKVLYREESNIIYIVDIVSTRQSPEKLKNK